MSGRPRVIIAENDALVATALQLTLNDLGCDVCGIAGTADEAVRLADGLSVDFAVIDVDLDGHRDGLAAARHIAGVLRVPVIVCSARATRSDAHAVGASAFLAKPFRRDQLVGVLAALVRTDSAEIGTRKTVVPFPRPSGA